MSIQSITLSVSLSWQSIWNHNVVSTYSFTDVNTKFPLMFLSLIQNCLLINDLLYFCSYSLVFKQLHLLSWLQFYWLCPPAPCSLFTLCIYALLPHPQILVADCLCFCKVVAVFAAPLPILDSFSQIVFWACLPEVVKMHSTWLLS